MLTGALMAEKKKPDAKSPDVQPSGKSAAPSKEEYTEHVKLRRAFKIKLQHVALDAKKPMGMLIEELMGAAINREYKRITDANQEE